MYQEYTSQLPEEVVWYSDLETRQNAIITHALRIHMLIIWIVSYYFQSEFNADVWSCKFSCTVGGVVLVEDVKAVAIVICTKPMKTTFQQSTRDLPTSINHYTKKRHIIDWDFPAGFRQESHWRQQFSSLEQRQLTNFVLPSFALVELAKFHSCSE